MSIGLTREPGRSQGSERGQTATVLPAADVTTLLDPTVVNMINDKMREGAGRDEE